MINQEKEVCEGIIYTIKLYKMQKTKANICPTTLRKGNNI